uniref:Secreted protein n=1 Tax=Timema genevievae TaxID=629358 RepID=A0A7R9JYP4_TIMGE|nr:unnamed protein product [Timema genevievae]
MDHSLSRLLALILLLGHLVCFSELRRQDPQPKQAKGKCFTARASFSCFNYVVNTRRAMRFDTSGRYCKKQVIQGVEETIRQYMLRKGMDNVLRIV